MSTTIELQIPKIEKTSKGKIRKNNSVKGIRPMSAAREFLDKAVEAGTTTIEALEEEFLERFVRTEQPILATEFKSEDIALIAYILVYHNMYNRPIVGNQVSGHFLKIVGGEWDYRMSKIHFEENTGNLQDGQHRLLGIFTALLSRTVSSVVTFVIPNMPAKMAIHTDQNMRRTSAQNMAMISEGRISTIQTKVVKGALRMMARMEGKVPNITESELLSKIETISPFLEKLEATYNSSSKTFNSWAFWAPAVIAAFSSRKKNAEKYMNALWAVGNEENGYGIKLLQPVEVLHEYVQYLIENRPTGNRAEHHFIRGAIVFNAVMGGTKIDRLSLVEPIGENSSKGKLPKITEIKLAL